MNKFVFYICLFVGLVFWIGTLFAIGSKGKYVTYDWLGNEYTHWFNFTGWITNKK